MSSFEDRREFDRPDDERTIDDEMDDLEYEIDELITSHTELSYSDIINVLEREIESIKHRRNRLNNFINNKNKEDVKN